MSTLDGRCQINLIEQLTRDEGLRLKPYQDSEGKLTIGIGRNLDDVGISTAEAEFLLANDIAHATRMLEQACPWVLGMDEPRKSVLINMCFNMGIGGLLQFKNTLALIKDGEYHEASQEMLKSKWAEQVGSRSYRLSVQLDTGQWQ